MRLIQLDQQRGFSDARDDEIGGMELPP